MSQFETNERLLDAVKRGDRTLAIELLAAGADPNWRDLIGGYSPLCLAANRGDLAMTRALVSAGAVIDYCGNDVRESPLRAAILGGHTAVAKFLRTKLRDQ